MPSKVMTSHKLGFIRLVVEAYHGVFDTLYRTFAPRNKYGLTSRQMNTTMMIARNGKPGIVLARIYACNGCGIENSMFDHLLYDHKELLSDPAVAI